VLHRSRAELGGNRAHSRLERERRGTGADRASQRVALAWYVHAAFVFHDY
jgi:hypothetical protein